MSGLDTYARVDGLVGTEDPDDRVQVDHLVRRFFAAFDNRDGRSPMEDELLALFAAKAIVARDENGSCRMYSPTEFVAPRIALLGSGDVVGFHEWEESATTEVRGSIAVRTSRYAKSGIYDGTFQSGGGVKFFQFARLPSGWRIVALSWIDDA